MINTMVRTSEWQKPQKTQSALGMKTTDVQPAKTDQYQTQKPKSKPQQQVAGPGTKATTSPLAVQRGKSTPDTANLKNPDGPPKQDAMKKERGSKIALNTLLVPALVGIKPIDILFIPSLKGDYIEDWIVTGVEYQQTDGGVDVSIQGARQYGLEALMNIPLSEKWLPLAISKRLVGPGATLEAWEEYAWPACLRGAATSAGGTGTPAATEGPVALPVIPYKGP